MAVVGCEDLVDKICSLDGEFAGKEGTAIVQRSVRLGCKGTLCELAQDAVLNVSRACIQARGSMYRKLGFTAVVGHPKLVKQLRCCLPDAVRPWMHDICDVILQAQ